MSFDEGPLEQVRAPDPLAMVGGKAQVGDELVEVALDHGHHCLEFDREVRKLVEKVRGDAG